MPSVSANQRSVILPFIDKISNRLIQRVPSLSNWRQKDDMTFLIFEWFYKIRITYKSDLKRSLKDYLNVVSFNINVNFYQILQEIYIIREQTNDNEIMDRLLKYTSRSVDWIVYKNK